MLPDPTLNISHLGKILHWTFQTQNTHPTSTENKSEDLRFNSNKNLMMVDVK